MKVYTVLLTLLATLASLASADTSNNQTYASLPIDYVVSLGYLIDTVNSTPEPCANAATNNACIPQVDAASGDAVIINYAVNGTINPDSKVTIKGCFSPPSSKDRPWRKANAIISKDKQCSVAIAKGLAPQGTYTYAPGANTAPGTYFVKILEVCADGSYCGIGTSVGFYQINKIDDRPGWLMAMTGVFATIGPICLATFLIVEKMRKKSQ